MQNRVRPLLKISFFHLLILMGLFLKGPFLFAQEGLDQNASAPEAQVEEIHDSKKLEKVLQDYNKDKQKVDADAQVIKEMQATGEVSEAELDKGKLNDPDLEKKTTNEAREAYSKLGIIAEGNNKDLKKIKYSEALKTALRPLQKMSERELLATLDENSKNSKAGEMFAQFPKTRIFAVRLIRDPEAFPSLARILDDEDKLIRFGGIMLATVLVGFSLKRFLSREGRSIPKAFLFWFIRFAIVLALRAAVIISFYGDELTPMMKIAAGVLTKS